MITSQIPQNFLNSKVAHFCYQIEISAIAGEAWPALQRLYESSFRCKLFMIMTEDIGKL